MRRKFGFLAGVFLLTVGLSACGEYQPPRKEQARIDPPPAGQLWVRGAGATFPAALYEQWAERYKEQHPDLWLTYEPIGSGGGINRFITGSVDFGASDAAMSDAQITEVKQGVKLVPATAGMVVLAYNLAGVEGELRLPRDVYAAIFAGRITSWDDPQIRTANPDLKLPKRSISLVARSDGSGTTFAFTNHLSAIDPTWKQDGPGVGTLVDWPDGTMLVRGNEGVAQRIKISDGAIGYVGFEYAKRLNLSMASLENKSGNFVLASAESGQEALAATVKMMPEDLRLFITDPAGTDAYPIITYSWLLLYGQYADGHKKDAVKQFVTWGLTEGQAYSDKLGFIPLPEEVVTLARNAVDEIQ